jgi:hypothetical protein
MGGWISPRAVDSTAARDPSYSTSRCASPRGLGYFYLTTWEAASLKSISGHILQDDPSIREEVLDSRPGASVPRVLRFFLFGFFGISCQDFRWTLSQSLRLNLRLGGYSMWTAILQSHFHISSGFKTRQAFFEDLRRLLSRTLGTTREDFKIAQTSAEVHSSLGML